MNERADPKPRSFESERRDVRADKRHVEHIHERLSCMEAGKRLQHGRRRSQALVEATGVDETHRSVGAASVISSRHIRMRSVEAVRYDARFASPGLGILLH